MNIVILRDTIQDHRIKVELIPQDLLNSVVHPKNETLFTFTTVKSRYPISFKL